MIPKFRKKKNDFSNVWKSKAKASAAIKLCKLSCVLKNLNLAAVLVFILTFAKTKIMQVVSAREFRANQGKYLIKANEGQSVLLTSRYGSFKIVPISEEDNLTTRICKGLQQVKQMEDGKLPRRTIEDLLNEL